MTLLDTTFSNMDAPSYRQAYPGWRGSGNFASRTGAVDRNGLCYKFNGLPMDSRYPLSFTFPHTGSELTLDFTALGLQSLADESWGLANVSVTLNGRVVQVFLPVTAR